MKKFEELLQELNKTIKIVEDENAEMRKEKNLILQAKLDDMLNDIKNCYEIYRNTVRGVCDKPFKTFININYNADIGITMNGLCLFGYADGYIHRFYRYVSAENQGIDPNHWEEFIEIWENGFREQFFENFKNYMTIALKTKMEKINKENKKLKEYLKENK